MSITEELRKWAKDNTLQNMVLTTYPPQHTVHGVLETLLRIADRIDAEHERECREHLSKGKEYGIASNIEVGMLRGDAYAKLPVDADGEYIRVGDVMEWPTTRETFEVVGIGDGVLFYIEDGSEKADWTGATTKRHHHAPTVEDVLREFAEKMNENIGLYTGEVIDAEEWRDADKQTIAEYAKRLTLAGDEE